MANFLSCLVFYYQDFTIKRNEIKNSLPAKNLHKEHKKLWKRPPVLWSNLSTHTVNSFKSLKALRDLKKGERKRMNERFFYCCVGKMPLFYNQEKKVSWNFQILCMPWSKCSGQHHRTIFSKHQIVSWDFIFNCIKTILIHQCTMVNKGIIIEILDFELGTISENLRHMMTWRKVIFWLSLQKKSFSLEENVW